MPDPFFSAGTAAAAIQAAPAVIELIKMMRSEKGRDPTFIEIVDTVKNSMRQSLGRLKNSLDRTREELEKKGLDLNRTFEELIIDNNSWPKIWTWGTYWKLEDAREKADEARRTIDNNLADITKLLICNGMGENVTAALMSESSISTRGVIKELRNSNPSAGELLKRLVDIADDLNQQLANL